MESRKMVPKGKEREKIKPQHGIRDRGQMDLHTHTEGEGEGKRWDKERETNNQGQCMP